MMQMFHMRGTKTEHTNADRRIIRVVNALIIRHIKCEQITIDAMLCGNSAHFRRQIGTVNMTIAIVILTVPICRRKCALLPQSMASIVICSHLI